MVIIIAIVILTTVSSRSRITAYNILTTHWTRSSLHTHSIHTYISCKPQCLHVTSASTLPVFKAHLKTYKHFLPIIGCHSYFQTNSIKVLNAKCDNKNINREMCSRINMHTHVAPHPGPSQWQKDKTLTRGLGFELRVSAC